MFAGNCEKAIQRSAKMCLRLELSPRAAWRALHLFRFPGALPYFPPSSFLPSCASCVHPESLMKMHSVHYSAIVKPFNHQRREVLWLSSEHVCKVLPASVNAPPTKKKSAAESACVLWLLMRGYLKTNSLSAACTSLQAEQTTEQCSAR